MSDFGDNTTVESSSTRGDKNKRKAPQPLCASLDVKKIQKDLDVIKSGPLFTTGRSKETVFEKQGFIKFLGKTVGKASSGGWGNYGEDLIKELNKKSGKFKESLGVKSYYQHKANYEECTSNRTKSTHTFVNEKGEQIEKKMENYELKTYDNKQLKEMLEPFFQGSGFLHSSNLGVLAAFGEYIDKPKADIETQFDKIMKETKDHKDNKFFEKVKARTKKDEGSFAFKMIFCFACDYSSKILSARKTKQKEKIDGGDGDLTPYVQGNRNRRFFMMVLCIIGYIYFMFVLFESYRLIISSTNRILDARATYMVTMGKSEAPIDEGYMNYLYSFFTVMYEAGCGNLIEVLNVFKSQALLNAGSILQTAATEVHRVQFDRCSDSLFSCINGYLTGQSQQQALTAGQLELDSQLQIQYIEAVTNIKKSFGKTVSDFNFATTGFITGINGIFCCSIIMGNILFPKRYTLTHVTTSVVALQGSYVGGVSPFIAISSIVTQAATLFRPSTLRLELQRDEEEVPRITSGGKRTRKSKRRTIGKTMKTRYYM